LEKRKIAILGYGSVGQYLVRKIQNTPTLSALALAFVWNRDPVRFEGGDVPPSQQRYGVDIDRILPDYAATHGAPDLIVEVCHPDIIRQHGTFFLQHSHLFVSSVTALADVATEQKLRLAAKDVHGLYLPVGAAWGIQDILKMDRLDTLQGLSVTMRFNATALRLHTPLKEKLTAWLNDPALQEPLLLYEGSVRELAALAPNNVNTMTCVALAGSRIGLDGTKAILWADKQQDTHETMIDVIGPGGFSVRTTRLNPAKKGAVTGDETYSSFWASLLVALEGKDGVHFC